MQLPLTQSENKTDKKFRQSVKTADPNYSMGKPSVGAQNEEKQNLINSILDESNGAVAKT